MKIIAPTNMGNLALKTHRKARNGINPGGYYDRYSHLWEGGDNLSIFMRLFEPYWDSQSTKAIALQDEVPVQIDLAYDRSGMLDEKSTLALEKFEKWGLIRVRDVGLDRLLEAKAEWWKTNPIQRIEDFYSEITGLCNLNCLHCYRGGPRKGEPGLPADKIIEALTPFLRAGITSVVLTGGEPFLKLDSILEIYDFIDKAFPEGELIRRDNMFGPQIVPAVDISILTNGTHELTEGLAQRLLSSKARTSFQVSLDSDDERITDWNRGRVGVYKLATEFVRAAESYGLRTNNKRLKLGSKYFPGMQQLGNAVINHRDKSGGTGTSFNFGSLDHTKYHEDGWCKGFYRPNAVYLRPTGNVGNCIYGYGFLHEWGNILDHPMEEIMNEMQNSRIVRMCLDGSIEGYQHEIDQTIFDGRFNHICEVMAITMAYGQRKELLLQRGHPEDEARKLANNEVARLFKYQY